MINSKFLNLHVNSWPHICGSYSSLMLWGSSCISIRTLIVLLYGRITTIVGYVVIVRVIYFLQTMVTFCLDVCDRQFRNHCFRIILLNWSDICHLGARHILTYIPTSNVSLLALYIALRLKGITMICNFCSFFIDQRPELIGGNIFIRQNICPLLTIGGKPSAVTIWCYRLWSCHSTLPFIIHSKLGLYLWWLSILRNIWTFIRHVCIGRRSDSSNWCLIIILGSRIDIFIFVVLLIDLIHSLNSFSEIQLVLIWWLTFLVLNWIISI
jgi:hypothetical protein